MNQPFRPHLDLIQHGTRVRCALPSCGLGIVYAIHGEQAPDTIRYFERGVGSEGGRALLDVVFETGHRAIKVPEAIVRGLQWSVLDGIAGDNEIKSALAHADAVTARKEREAAEAEAAHAVELNRLRNDPALSGLEQGNARHSGKLAAKNIRTQLRTAFPGSKFSVRVTNYGTINLVWTDGPTIAQVEQITSPYRCGFFDGQLDSYEHSRTAWCEVFGGAEYIFTRRDFSDPLIEQAIATVLDRHAHNLTGLTFSATVEDYRRGRLMAVRVPGTAGAFGDEDVQHLVNQHAATITDFPVAEA